MMKKVVGILFLLFTCIHMLSFSSFAIGTHFSTREIPEKFKGRHNVPEVFQPLEQPAQGVIEGFDVREDGWIVLRIQSNKSHDNSVNIFDAQGKFQYGFWFPSYGSFFVEWSKETPDNINIATTRSRLIIEVSPDGKMVAFEEIISNTDTDNAWKMGRLRTHIIGDVQYEITQKHSFLIKQCCDSLIKKTKNGEQTVLYYAGGSAFRENLKFSLLLIIFPIAIFFCILADDLKHGCDDTLKRFPKCIANFLRKIAS